MRNRKKRNGFSLMEMAIVFGIVGMVLGGVWVYASLASRTAKTEQSVESINLVLENTRNVFAGQTSISGGVAYVVPFLVTSGAMPTGLVSSAATVCQGTPGQYAVNAWGSSGDPCGSLRLCAWPPLVGIGASPSNANACPLALSPGTSSQHIGVEFSGLNYSSCISLATRITPTSPAPGLADVYINGTSIWATQGGLLPATVKSAETSCAAASPAIVDFVYTLRAPQS